MPGRSGTRPSLFSGAAVDDAVSVSAGHREPPWAGRGASAAAAGGVGVPKTNCPWRWESGKVSGSATLFSLCTELTSKLLEWMTANPVGSITPDRAPDGRPAGGPCLLTAVVAWHFPLAPWTPDTPGASFFGVTKGHVPVHLLACPSNSLRLLL